MGSTHSMQILSDRRTIRVYVSYTESEDPIIDYHYAAINSLAAHKDELRGWVMTECYDDGLGIVGITLTPYQLYRME